MHCVAAVQKLCAFVDTCVVEYSRKADDCITEPSTIINQPEDAVQCNFAFGYLQRRDFLVLNHHETLLQYLMSSLRARQMINAPREVATQQ